MSTKHDIVIGLFVELYKRYIHLYNVVFLQVKI